MPAASGIYLIRHEESGKVYVGSSINLRKRLHEHVRRLNRGDHPNQHLLAAWALYGPAAFSISVLELTDDLTAAEQRHIDSMNAADRAFGYNKQAIADRQTGMRRSAETCARIGAAKRGNKNRLGQTLDDDARQRISTKLKGRRLPDEVRLKMAAARRGVPKSAEWIAKIQASRRKTLAAKKALST